MSRPNATNRRNSFQPPIITLGAALYEAYTTRKEKRASGSAQEIGRSGGKYAAVPFGGGRLDDGQGGEVERMREGDVFGDGNVDVPPPDYEDVVGEIEGGGAAAAAIGHRKEKREIRDGGIRLICGMMRRRRRGAGGSADVKMGFFERMRARKEAKRRAWMERRAERGGARGGGQSTLSHRIEAAEVKLHRTNFGISGRNNNRGTPVKSLSAADSGGAESRLDVSEA
ncbi:hypothetical protein Q7P36_007797 [Cladosporium allicinum]